MLPETVVQEGCMVHGFYLPPWGSDLDNIQPQNGPVGLSKMQKAALRDWCSISQWLARQGRNDL